MIERISRWHAVAATLVGSPFVASGASLSTSRQVASGPLSPGVVADQPLPNDTSRFDYLSLDPAAGRLCIAPILRELAMAAPSE
jgi:hypothetical protein